MNNLTLGSLFDGSGGFPLGGLISGITPLWASEIEPFPIRVTTKRLPNIKHLGDISKVSGADIDPVDIITFGSPCTDMSVAGKRAGLDGQQSVLFYQAIRIVKEMRCKSNGKYPRFIVWENVPGAFSSNKGEDFKAVLDAVCKVKSEGYVVPMPENGKWANAGNIMADDFSLAWRVFNAQYWGVPQRRKRIYLVADFAGGSAGKILFESEGVSGYSPKSLRPWQGTAGTFKEGTLATGIDGYNGSLTGDAAATLGENCGISTGRNGVIVLNDQGGNRMDVTEDMTCTLRAKSNHPPLVFENHSQDSRYVGPLETAQTVLATFGTGGNNQPFVMEAYGICAKESNSMKSDNPNSGFYKADTSRTIDKSGGNPTCNQGGIAVVCVDQGGGKSACNITENMSPTLTCTHGGEPVVCLQGSMIGRKDENGPQGSGVNDDVSFTLNATDKHAVVYAIDRESFNCGQNFARNLGITADGVNPTLNAQGPSAVATPTYSSSKASFFTSAEKELANTLVATDYKDPPIVNDGDELKYIVRRLTPTECARLQGFPDWWCSELGTENPTNEEVDFWKEVFETHRKIMGTSTKPKSEKQIIKWLQNPHSDSAEYKMWGNGVALPNVVFVLSGIVWSTQSEGQ